MKTIKVIVSPKGKTDVKVEGVMGPSCETLAKGLEEALGEVNDSGQTEEYFVNIGENVDCCQR